MIMLFFISAKFELSDTSLLNYPHFLNLNIFFNLSVNERVSYLFEQGCQTGKFM